MSFARFLLLAPLVAALLWHHAASAQEVAEEFAQPFLSEIDRPKEIDVARGARVCAEPVAKE